MTACEGLMARLRVRELAEKQGHTMSSLQRDSRQTMNLIRRYWYNTADGKEEGQPLVEVRLKALDAIADVLKVDPGDLIIRSE